MPRVTVPTCPLAALPRSGQPVNRSTSVIRLRRSCPLPRLIPLFKQYHMHEPVAPPKKQVPYAWLVGAVTILSVCAMVMSVSNGATANKNLNALIAAQSIAAKNAEELIAAKAEITAKEQAMQARIEGLSFELSETRRSLQEALGRSNQNRLNKSDLQGSSDGTTTSADFGSRRGRLFGEGLLAEGGNNLYFARSRFMEILANDPNDVEARQRLVVIEEKIAKLADRKVK